MSIQPGVAARRARRFFEEMELVLQYEGPLPSSQSSNADRRREIQDEMRRVFHDQLVNFWKTTEPLKQYWSPGYLCTPPLKGDFLDQGGWYSRQVGQFRFVPLVVRGGHLKLVCKLDILILSRDEPGAIVTIGGDLDNRVKVLLDALTVPQANQLKERRPGNDEQGFFCLLDDDHLVTELNIKTSRQHRPLRNGERESDVEVTVTATIKTSDQSTSPLRL